MECTSGGIEFNLDKESGKRRVPMRVIRCFQIVGNDARREIEGMSFVELNVFEVLKWVCVAAC
jgi:hypothetical protein